MSVSLASSPLLLILCAAIAAGLTYWTYQNTTPLLPGPKRLLLGGLRFTALFLILVLLFDPILRRVQRQSRPPVLAVLVDDSQSLGLGRSGSDSSAAGNAVRDLLRQLPVNQVEGQVRIYRFASDARSLQGRLGSWADSLHFEGQRTDISRALDYVREDLEDANLRSVLLVSDGQYNTGRNPLYLAERYPVPINTAVVGDTTAQRDLLIQDVVTNDIMYAGTEQPVQVRLRARGLAAQAVTVTLMQGRQMLASKRVDLPEGTAELPVDLTFTPDRVGFQQFSAYVTHLPGELTYENNTAVVNARVLKRKKQVLLVSAAPDPDLAAIRQVLDENPDVEITMLVQKATGTFYEESAPPDVASFDALIMAGFPGSAARPNQIERLADAARDGTPLLFVLTQQTDLNLLRQYFGDLLPAQPVTVRNDYFDASFVPTPAAATHPIFDLTNVPPDAWRRLPPVIYNGSRWQTTPDARVLATIQVRGVSLDDPLLAVRQLGDNRSAVLLGAGTWRWKNLPEDLADLETYWPQLLSNTIRWITTREDKRPVRVEPVEEVFAGGESVAFTGQVYDGSLQPVDGASIEVKLIAPDSTEYPYRMESVGNGRYALEVGALPEGTYRYQASADRGGSALGTDAGSFAVGSLNLEFRETQANVPLMRQLARRSGGTFFTPGDLGAVPAALQASGTFEPDVREVDRSTEFRNLFAFGLVIVALLSAEWFLRKRSGLV
ncbi:MAG TPA: hypothetical protein VFG50_12035 [Rhodothermales bacterium]|nr:hypothetical protein [Rhodothermales bacterium]